MTLGAVILAGGRSTRMKHPKAWLPFGGKRLLQRVVDVCQQAAGLVVVVGAADQPLPSLPERIMILQDEQDGLGPMQGVAIGLESLADRCDRVYVTSCDVPFLSPEWISTIVEQLGSASIAIPHVGERLHPLAAVYRPTVASAARVLLAADQRRLLELCDHVPTRRLTEADLIAFAPAFRALRNVNTPADYVDALEEFENLTSATETDS